MACHGQKQPKSGYQLHTFQSLMKPGDFGTPPITPGKPDESQLFELLAETDKDSWMPKEGPRLSDEQIALFKRWIEQGAKFDADDKTASLSSIIPTIYGKAPAAYRAPTPITALAFNSEGNELAAGGYSEITIWNSESGELLRRIGQVAQRTYALAYSPDGKQLAAASGAPGQSGEVKLFDPASGASIKSLATMSDVAFDVVFSPDGKQLACAAADRTIRVYDVASGKELALIEDHADWVMGVAFSPDGKRLASASRDKTSKVFDAKSGESQVTYNGHGQPVYGVAFSPDGKQVITCGADKQIHVWNPADGKKIANITGFGGEVFDVAVAGDSIFSCCADKSLRQHNLAKRNLVRAYAGLTDYAYSLAVHPETKRLAGGAFDGQVRVWNTDDGKEVASFLAAPGYVPPAAQAGK